MELELIEYYWNEITEQGELVYEDPEPTAAQPFMTKTVNQPLKVQTPTKEKYWGELLHYIRTQGDPCLH